MCNKKQFLALATVLALVTGFLVGHFTAPPVGALTRAYLKVTHRDIYGNTVAAADGYTVEYKLFDRTIPPFGQWQPTWTDRTGTGQIDASCSPYGTYRWKYETYDFDESRYTSVKWRIQMTEGYDGTRCSDGAAKDYCQTEYLQKETIPGGTASITAGCYQ